MKSRQIASSLQQLQARQFQHDNIAHQDILHLSLSRRLTHFTLHFAKYQAAILEASKTHNLNLLSRALTDSFIIVLAAANAMSVDLRKSLANSVSDGFISLQQTKHTLTDVLPLEFIEVVGKMAKACEAMDHLEDYPSRNTLENSIVKLLLLTERFSSLAKIDLMKTIPARWEEVENRFFLNRGQISSSNLPNNHLSVVAKR